jgi:predicted permease
MLSDLRLAFRSLRRSPGFTIVAVLTLALGLGVNVAVFGIINEFMIRPLPVRAPRELAFVMQRNPKLMSMPFMLSYPDYRDLRSQIESTAEENRSVHDLFSDLIAYAPHAAHISEDGHGATRGWVHEVSDNYFEVLGVGAEVGRVFQAGEGVKRNADPLAILSHGYWVQRFGGDRGIIGRKLLINGAPFTVIGVTPKGFGGTEAMTQAQIFVPAMMADQLRPQAMGAIASRGNTSHMLMVRMRPGVTAAAAAPVIDRMLQNLIKAYPNDHAASTAILVPEALSRPSPFVSEYTGPALAALMLLAALVLAVAAANIANLLFARAADTERSLAIRSSLGATRGRLIRQLVAESMVLALLAAVVAWYLSAGFGAILSDIGTSTDNPPMATPEPSGWVLVFTVAAAVATGIATGIAPAWRATRLDVLALLKDGAPAGGRRRHPFRTMLVGAQIALACIVLVCAGLAVRSLRALQRVDLGFQPGNVLLATFDLEMQRYNIPRAENFQRELLRQVRALPGVVSAGLARSVPFDRNFAGRGGVGADGYVPEKNELFIMGYIPVTPGYIEAMQMRLRSGRSFTDADDAKSRRVAVISNSVAAHYWPGQHPTGRHLIIEDQSVEVIGVISEVRYLMMTEAQRPLVLVPQAQSFSPRVTLVARTRGSPLALASSIETISHRLDPGLPIHNLTTLEQHIASSPLGLMVLRMGTIIAATQGALVLLLSVMGVYGLVSFAVSRRTREIGIRMALGASAADVIRLVTRPSLTLTIIALVLGLAVARLLSRGLGSLLFGGLSGTAFVMAAVAVLLVAITVLACWLPARRALRINPVDALRAE